MAKRTFLAGATSQSMDVFIQDSSSTVGAGLSGLLFNTANLKAYYRKGATGTLTAITLATQTVGGAWSSGGFVEIDATNGKGLYRFDIPDTILASSPAAIIHFFGAANMAQLVAELEIVAYDPFNATNLGLSRIDDTITSRMATFTLPANFALLSINGAGQVDVIKIAGTTQTAGDIYALLVTVAGYLDTEILAIKNKTDQLVFTIANQLDVNVVDWKGAVAPAMTGDAFARLGAPAGASIAADIVAVKADTAAIKVQTDKMVFTVANQLDVNVIDWKGAVAPAMTGDAFARLGAPAGASVSADIAAVKVDTNSIGIITTAVKNKTDQFVFTVAGQVDSNVITKTGFALAATGLDLVIMSDLAGVPAATAKLTDAISWVFMSTRNQRVTDGGAATDTVSNNAGAVIGTANVTDAANVFTRTKYA